MQNSKIPYFFLGLAAVLAISAVSLWFLRPGIEDPPPPAGDVATPVTPARPVDPPIPVLDAAPDELDVQPTPLEALGRVLVEANPEDLVARIADALKNGDSELLTALLGGESLDDATRSAIQRMIGASPGGEVKFREVGELERNRRTRWAIELGESAAADRRIFLDLELGDDGWKVAGVQVPETSIDDDGPSPKMDSLSVADAFLQNVLRQNFMIARRYVDPTMVSDAKIAGLCILFEEGNYHLRASRPLRVLFQRGDTASYLANVDAANGAEAAQFGVNLRQSGENGTWLVTEINLDQLLADYASRVAGGDVYYSPLVRNPGGGDTIALYFDFDDDGLGPRTLRQLEIIAAVLLSDPNRKITLSGHTDALGSQTYNDSLSARRAKIVRDFLAEAGVDAKQIVTLAKGASQPRRPNVTETGDDDPDGRRANRRTEIYLDF